MTDKSDGTKREKSDDNGFEGGYMSVKKQKLAQQCSNQKASVSTENYLGLDLSDCGSLFKGISIFVNGYTKPSAAELKFLVTSCGGNYDHYYSVKTTTHIIATMLPHVKRVKVREEKVVLPQWIMDCVEAKTLLPLDGYYVVLPLSLRSSGNLKTEAFPKSAPTATVSKNSENSDINCCLPIGAISPRIVLTPSKKHIHGNSTSHSSVIEQASIPEGPAEPPFSRNLNGSMEESSRIAVKGSSTIKTSIDPDFVKEFFSRSRLHHIATAGNDFKVYVRQLIDNHTGEFKGLERLKTLCTNNKGKQFSKAIMIIDMDCFFVSVALKKRPHLRGKPVAVTHSKTGKGPLRKSENLNADSEISSSADIPISEDESDVNDNDWRTAMNEHPVAPQMQTVTSSSEVASCSYEARTFGVHAGMYVGKAMQLCPELITVPYEFEEYSSVTKILYDTVASYTLNIEAVSCDELYIDVTDILNSIGLDPLELASTIRKEIETKTGGCTASVGISSNKLLAKLALKSAKPNGQMYLPDDKQVIQEFLRKQKVENLPEVGYSASARLKEVFDVDTCEQLQQVPLCRLQSEFGERTGKKIHEYSLGIDKSELKIYKATDRKSVSATINYGIRFKDYSQVERFLTDLSNETVSRLNAIKARGKQITIKILTRNKEAPIEPRKYLGHGVCDNICKSSSLRVATNSASVIGKEVLDLFKSVKCNIVDLRGMGIQIGKLEFENNTRNEDRNFGAAGPSRNLLHYFSSNSPTKQATKNKGVKVDRVSPVLSNTSEPLRVPSAETAPNFSSETLPSSLNMIDEETLNALPDDIRKEILESYNMPSTNHATSSLSTKTSAPPKAAPKKPKKVVKTNSKKVSQKGKQTIDGMFNAMKNSQIDAHIINLKRSNRANVCGMVRPESVVSLMEEWVDTEEDLLDQDIAYVTNYFFNLIEEKNFTQLKIVLEALHKSMLRRNSKEWNLAYNEIVKSVLSELQVQQVENFFPDSIPLIEVCENTDD